MEKLENSVHLNDRGEYTFPQLLPRPVHEPTEVSPLLLHDRVEYADNTADSILAASPQLVIPCLLRLRQRGEFLLFGPALSRLHGCPGSATAVGPSARRNAK